jgi:hypothetical protein
MQMVPLLQSNVEQMESCIYMRNNKSEGPLSKSKVKIKISSRWQVIFMHSFTCFSKMISLKRILSYILPGKKDIPTSYLSIGENCRFLAVAVIELLRLHPSLFHTCAGISWFLSRLIAYQYRFCIQTDSS